MNIKVKKYIKNKRVLFTIILIMILMICIISIVVKKNSPLEKAKNRLSYILEEKSWEEYGERYPDGTAALKRNYIGDLTIFSIGKSMYYIATDFLPYEYQEVKNKDDIKLSKYYEKNVELLKVTLGIKNKKQFMRMSNLLKSLNVDKLEFESFYIDVNSIKLASTYTTANLVIKYKNCNDIILNIKINNRKDNNISSIIYTAL